MTPDEIDAIIETETDHLASCAARGDGLRDQLVEMRRLLALHGPELIPHLGWERPSKHESDFVAAWIDLHVKRGEDDPNDDLLLAHLASGIEQNARAAAVGLRYFGDRARPLALSLARRLKAGGAGGLSHAFGLTAVYWGLRGYLYPDALKLAASAGLLPSAPPLAFHVLSNHVGNDASEPALFYKALELAGVAVCFDRERGGENDRLVGSFALATSGVFTPTDLWQSQPRPAPGRPTYEEVEVAFTWNGARTTFVAEYLGDLVDDRAVARAINGALAAAQRPERFFRVTDGDLARFVFGDPATVARVREELLLFLDDGKGNVDEAEHARLKQRLVDALT